MYNAFTYYVCLLMYKLQLCSSFCHKLPVVARQPGTAYRGTSGWSCGVSE